MRADTFYTQEVEGSIPIHVWDAETHSKLNVKQKSYVDAMDFAGQSGQVQIIPNAEGGIEKVYIGQGSEPLFIALAKSLSKLPQGQYRLESAFDLLTWLYWSLEQYQYDRYVAPCASPRVLYLDAAHYQTIINQANATFLTRDLINAPTNAMGPSELAQATQTLAEQFGARFNQWTGDELLVNNFPAIHAVGRAAADAPRLLHLQWGNPNHPKVALIGKGVCFDSGGLDIKPVSAMQLMKKDMGGAAQALGLSALLMSEKTPVFLDVWIPAVENAIGSRAYRPGDVLTMRNGLHVEIDNTDAEGRLVLADAMVRACEDKPDLMIDFATLTGAARSAVGTEIAAMFTNQDKLADALSKVSMDVHDPVWRLPLYAPYIALLDSTIADMANSGRSPYAGAITAALFLERFVAKGIPWIHFDLMAWNVNKTPGKPIGGEAMALRACADYIIKNMT